MPRMGDPNFVKRYYARSNTIAQWWHPESRDPRRNPLLPFREILLKEASDVANTVGPRENFVLDAGTGEARLFPRLIEEGVREMCGLDISAEMLSAAKDHQEILHKVQFVRGDLERLPFRDSAFDVTTCIQTLVHVPSPRLAISELCRITATGGKILIDFTVKNTASVLWYFRSLSGILSLLNATVRFVAIYFPYGPLRDMGGPWKQYSADEIEPIAKTCGMEKMGQFEYGARRAIYILMVFRKVQKVVGGFAQRETYYDSRK